MTVGRKSGIKRPNSNSGSLGQFLRGRERMVHVSKRFMPNPAAVLAEQANKPFYGPRYLALPGETLDLGRNAAKRARRAGGAK